MGASTIRKALLLPSVSILLLMLLASTMMTLADNGGLCGLDSKPTEDGAPSSCSSGGKGGKDDGVKDEEEKKPAAKFTFVPFEGREETAEEVEKWEKLAYSKMSYTNEQDWLIHDQLDEADEFIVEQPEKSIALFQAILKSHPLSARATYALARTKQFVNTTTWSEEDKARNNREIHDALRQLIKRHGPRTKKSGEEGEGKEEEEGDDETGGVPLTLFHSAAHQGLLHAEALNNTAMKVEILQETLATPKGFKMEKYHELLVQEFILCGEYEDALEAVEIATKQFYHSKHLKFLQGFVLKRLGRKKEANALLRTIEADEAAGDTFLFGSDVLDLCYELSRRGGRDGEVDDILKEASKIHLFISRYQRPLEAVPDLESKPVWSLEEDVGLTTHDEEIAILRESVADIAEEVRALRSNDSGSGGIKEEMWTSNEYFVKGGGGGGTWEEFPLYSWGKRRYFHCSLAPKTCGVLKRFPAASRCAKCTAKFVVLGPGTHVRTHLGPTNTRLRLHLALKVPPATTATATAAAKPSPVRLRVGKGEVLEWSSEGKMFVFDDSYEHEMWNEDEKAELVVLSVDLPHPDVKDHKTKFSAGAKNIYLSY